MYYSKGFKYNHLEFVGYKKCDKLIWTSGKVCRNTNTLIKQGLPKINMNMTSPLEMLGFGCYPHKDTCDILSEMWFHRYFKHVHQ